MNLCTFDCRGLALRLKVVICSLALGLFGQAAWAQATCAATDSAVTEANPSDPDALAPALADSKAFPEGCQPQ